MKSGDLTSHIVSLNLFRRHLTTSQRAMIGARLKPTFEAEARERQATSTGGAEPQLQANLPEADKGQARDKAAEAVKVSPRSIEAASTVPEKGTPELIKAVDEGGITPTVEVNGKAPPNRERCSGGASGKSLLVPILPPGPYGAARILRACRVRGPILGGLAVESV